MKVEIPDQLKADLPLTWFGRILAATPVVMAVVATMLAGLASSEMTSAQYDRSLAAQQQSKAGDQWSFFQAKRLRGAFQRNTAELLQTLAEVHPLDPAVLRKAAEGNRELSVLLDAPGAAEALGYLQRGETPSFALGGPNDPKVKAALDALDRLAPDTEMAAALAPVAVKTLDTVLRAARDQADAFDAATKPINALVDQLDAVLPRVVTTAPTRRPGAAVNPGANPGAGAGTEEAKPQAAALLRDFTAARLRYTAARYEVESRLNQSIANIYELQVRKSNFAAERRHARSQKFFYGMLGAQLGVIVSTFAMAARKRNLLWSLAAGAGVLAIAFAIYVYLYI